MTDPVSRLGEIRARRAKITTALGVYEGPGAEHLGFFVAEAEDAARAAMGVGAVTGDRVEAAARAVDKELADSATGPLYIGHLDFFPERAARSALAAADEADRVAGVVRLDTRDDATFRLIRRACNDPGQFLPRGEQYDGEPNTLGHWQAMAVVAALAAAGAQEETHD